MPEPNCACAAGCNAVASPMANAVRSSFFMPYPFGCGWCGKALQQYRVTAVRQEFPSGFVQDGRPVACTVRPVLSSSLRGPPFAPRSASLRSAFLRNRRSHRGSPWHRPGIRRCIGPTTFSPFPLCSDIRQGPEPIGVRGRGQLIALKISLEALWNGVVGRYLQEAVKNAGRRLRDAGRSSVGKCLRAAGGDGAAALRDLAGTGNDTQGDRSTEDFQVMVVDLVFQPFFTDLVEAVKLVEIDGVTIRHNQPVKSDGHAPLLSEARRSSLLGFTEHDRSLGDNDVLTIMRIQRI